MDYIDHHAHMTSRTTDDYDQMALTGCLVLTEPAFWAGYDRATPSLRRLLRCAD
jgi:predicted metal-dependent TIM-barrel fold hydrolase